MNRIEFSATMIFNEENLEKAKEIVKNQKVTNKNFNLIEDLKNGDLSPRILIFDNIIKIYLPISYMGTEGAEIADSLIDLSYGYYMDKVFESNEYSTLAFYKGEYFYYDSFPEVFTSRRLQYLEEAKSMRIKLDHTTELIERLCEDYSCLMSSEFSCNIEERLVELFYNIKKYKDCFSKEDMDYIIKSIDEESETIGVKYKAEYTEDMPFEFE
jgi:hypothetical protein